MADSREPVQKRVIRGCSRLVLFAGGAVFLLGGKFLYEIRHLSFFVSEAVGIVGGVLLMLLGAGLTIAAKSSKPEQHLD
jgi:hypothetical protein